MRKADALDTAAFLNNGGHGVYVAITKSQWQGKTSHARSDEWIVIGFREILGVPITEPILPELRGGPCGCKGNKCFEELHPQLSRQRECQKK